MSKDGDEYVVGGIGAVVGAVVGGPIGALVGGAVAGLVGKAAFDAVEGKSDDKKNDDD